MKPTLPKSILNQLRAASLSRSSESRKRGGRKAWQTRIKNATKKG